MKKIFALLMITALFLCFTGCSTKTVSETGFYLDTAVTITINGDEAQLEAAFDEIQRLEQLLSITVSDSDVSRINDGSSWIDVSDETLYVINEALKYCELSDGAFDITIQPLTELWNVNDGGPVPKDADIQKMLELVDYTRLQINDNAILAGDISINLGGVAKGYIADKVCELLKSEGVDTGLINLGGNVVVFGDEYTIGIRDPFGDENELVGVVNISNGSVVTSGGYERNFVENGVTYHHILDPNTGYPAKSGLAGVTIISQSSCEADALSTTVYIMGAEKGMELIESLDGVEALLITDEGELILSSGMSEYFIAY